MTVDKLYTSLPANHIMAKLTNHVQQTRLNNNNVCINIAGPGVKVPMYLWEQYTIRARPCRDFVKCKNVSVMFIVVMHLASS